MISPDPREVRSDTPVGIFAKRRSPNSKIVIAAGRPFIGIESHQQAAILVYVSKTKLLQRIDSGSVLVLLTGIDAGSSRVAGAYIKDEVWIEHVRPRATIVTTFPAASG